MRARDVGAVAWLACGTDPIEKPEKGLVSMDRISRVRRHAVVALIAAGAALTPVAYASAADESTTDGMRAASTEWSTEYAGARASGIRWVEGAFPERYLHVEGELTGPADGCASVWEQWTHDFVVFPKKKIATACDGESVPVRTGNSVNFPTISGQLWLCEGTTSADNCGQPVRLTGS